MIMDPVDKTDKMYRIPQFVWRPLIFGYIFSMKYQLNLSTDVSSDIDQLVVQYFNGFI